MQEPWVWSLGWEGPLEKEMATHSSVLAWEIPWTEEPGGLQYRGSHRVGHDRSDLAQHSALIIACCLLSPTSLLPSAQGDSYVLQWQGVFIAQTLSQSKYLNICWVVQPGIRSYQLEIDHRRTYLVVQCLRLGFPGQRVQVWSLVEELGSHMFLSQKNQNVKQKQYVTNSIKTLKNSPHQKHLKKKKNKEIDSKNSF